MFEERLGFVLNRRSRRKSAAVASPKHQHSSKLPKSRVTSVSGRESLKGIVLAGGLGSRLHPLTRVTNKHLLPVYDRPMIFYPIQTLVDAGIEEILIVTGGQNAGDFLRLLSNGKDFGLKHLNYAYQEGEGGIADALRLAQHFTDGDSMCVVLGDNVIQGTISGAAEKFRAQEKGAHLLLKAVHDPHRFGCPEIVNGQILRIEEKPKNPKSNYAVTGLYFFDKSVFEKIGRLTPSTRGELEVTDINNMYLQEEIGRAHV